MVPMLPRGDRHGPARRSRAGRRGLGGLGQGRARSLYVYRLRMLGRRTNLLLLPVWVGTDQERPRAVSARPPAGVGRPYLQRRRWSSAIPAVPERPHALSTLVREPVKRYLMGSP